MQWQLHCSTAGCSLASSYAALLRVGLPVSFIRILSSENGGKLRSMLLTTEATYY
jgi:hypothetical protein